MTYTLKGDSATTDPTPNPGEDTKLDAPAYTIAEKDRIRVQRVVILTTKLPSQGVIQENM